MHIKGINTEILPVITYSFPLFTKIDSNTKTHVSVDKTGEGLRLPVVCDDLLTGVLPADLPPGDNSEQVHLLCL